MHHYLIYYIRKILRILIFGYLASNITINSTTSSYALNLSVTLLYSQYPTNYGFPILVLAPSVVTTKSSTIGHTDIFWLGTMVTGQTMNITQTNLSRQSAAIKTCKFRISNRRFQILMMKNTLNVLSQNFHGCNHAECTVPTYKTR